MAIYNGTNGNDSYNGTSSADVINGLSGDDSLYGSSGDDSIYGGLGNDTLYGGSGINLLDGGDGDDKLWSSGPGGIYLGGLGNDTLTGNSGTDSMDGGAGNDSLYSSSGDDTLSGADGNDTLSGGDGHDLMDGGNDADTLYGGLGNDTLTGGDGNDELWGEDDNDNLNGGAGNDIVYSGYGNDTLTGGDGNDKLWGEDDNDNLSGDAGNDTLYGNYGNDTLTGGDGNDQLWGDEDNDNLSGGAGDDTLDGGDGKNVLKGGAGDDTYYLTSYDTVIDDTEGNNTIIIAANLDNIKIPQGFNAIYESEDTLHMPYFMDAVMYQGVKHSSMGTGVTLKYTFVSGEFTDAEKKVFADVMAKYAAVTNLKFELVASDTVGAYLIDKTTTVSGGSSNYPDSSSPTLKINPNSASDQSLAMHEIGHYLGLKHPGDYNGATVGGQEGPFLPVAEDNLDNSIMSYTDVHRDWTHVRPFDLASVQYLFGVNASARATNDTYTPVAVYSASNPDTHFIWDGSGTDTISLTNAAAGATVDMRDGAWSWVGAAKAASILADGQFFINPNTIIENLTGSAFADTVRGNESDNSINGGAGNDSLRGMQGNDTLMGDAGADTLEGGAGDDTYVVDSSDTVVESAGQGIDTVQADFSYALGAGIDELTLTGSTAINGTGNALDNWIAGNSAANGLIGGAGNDTLDGSAGIDTVTYSGSTAGYSLTYNGAGNLSIVDTDATNGNDGTDALLNDEVVVFGDRTLNLATFDANFYLTTYSDIKALYGTDTLAATKHFVSIGFKEGRLGSGSGNLTLTGTAGADSLTGAAGNDTLDGGLGNDTLDGGAGIDTVTYASASSAATVLLYSTTAPQATGGSGNDTLLNIENLIGSNYDDQLKGNNANNVLTGGAGNDLLDGWSGADTMIGGAGNDRYYVNISGDVVVETDSNSATGGVDTVYSMLSGYTLGANVENGVLYTSSAMNMTGNSLNNVLTGNINANVLDGAAGADTMIGGDGSDRYEVDNVGDVVSETNADSVTGGVDTVSSSVNYTLGSNVENLILTGTAAVGTGNALDNTITANAADNTIDGGAGIDTVTYASASSAVTVLLYSTTAPQATGGSGSDTLLNIENLIGSNYDDQLKGNSANNVLTGGTGNDTLNGGLGNDTLIGGAGIDTADYSDSSTYVTVNLLITTAQNTLGAGTDVLTDIENLTGSDYNDSLRGNNSSNILIGGLGIDFLDGRGGADTMIGGGGSDSYYVDNAGDVVVETDANTTTGGNDIVYSQIASYTLGANIESGVINTNSATNITGNALNNSLYAGGGDNVIDGGDGSDTVNYGKTSVAVTVSLAITGAQATTGSGSDTLMNIEHLTGSDYNDTLIGNSLNNALNGGSGDDVLDGGAGADSLNGATGNDTMIGGDGNDTYYVDSTGDVVIETSTQSSTGGYDYVYSNLASYTLGSNIENGLINVASNANLYGNELNNVLFAGSGNNLLDGGAGVDFAHYGNSTTAVSINLSITTAQSTGGSGLDTLVNIENLVGSNYNDTLIGNSGNNRIEGRAGNDTLRGDAGSDTLMGGDGNDVFDFDALTELGLGAGVRDVIESFVSGSDLIDISGIDANTVLSGDQAFSLVTSFSTTAGEVRYSGGIIYLNTDNDTAAEYEIQLTGTIPTALSTADFVL